MTFVVGSYALAWGRSDAQKAQVLDTLSDESAVGGLELPSGESLGSKQIVSLLSSTRPDWRVVITALPATMTRLADQPAFGLASTDRSARGAAVDELAALRSAIVALHDTCGRAVVSAVELHSAPGPTTGPGARTALARSLATVGEWHWDGAQLLLEHVDARVADQPASKGFLSLEDEIGVIAGHALPVGILVNWGRSAIELRSAARVVEHVATARQAGLLRGLVFSGVSDVATDYGDPWADQHLPTSLHEPGSLLTLGMMEEAMRAAGPVDYTGVKMSWRGAAMSEGAAMVLETVRTVAEMSDRHRTVASQEGNAWVEVKT